jgi:hypothetical protein
VKHLATLGGARCVASRKTFYEAISARAPGEPSVRTVQAALRGFFTQSRAKR